MRFQAKYALLGLSVLLRMNAEQQPKQTALDSVLRPSNAEEIKGNPVIRGPNLDDETLDLDRISDYYLNIGYQGSAMGYAMVELNRMLSWRLSDEPYDPNAKYPEDPAERAKIGCKIFLGFTSNLISSGLRELIVYLVKHKLVDVVVTSCGGIEEDLIKCLAPTYLADWSLSGRELRAKSLNRIGNLLVPNDNYCKFEDWILPVLDECYLYQYKGYHWTPSRLTHFFGKRINDESSFLYWAAKNDIPVFCPAITDGSIGDMLYFHSYKRPGLIVDVVADIRAMNNQAVYSPKNGVLILGGGMCKHHIMNANLFTAKGADFCVYVNTAQEFDGCDSGARPDEAISWGKISPDAQPVKVYCDATIAFPILVRKCFYRAFIANPAFYEMKQYADPHTMYAVKLDEEQGFDGIVE